MAAGRSSGVGAPSRARAHTRPRTSIEGSRDADADSSVLVVEGLVRHFGARRVLDGLDLTARAGERIALRGPNGSGKTTLLRCAAGTLTPTRGSISILGHDAGSLEARALIGTSLSQERSFYLRLSGRANLVFFARIRGHTARAAAQMVRSLEDELELEPILSERVDRCSTGMVQQLSFARALISNPPLLLLDEPTRSLDSEGVRRLWSALERRPQSAVVIATHLEDDVDRCTRLVELPRSRR